MHDVCQIIQKVSPFKSAIMSNLSAFLKSKRIGIQTEFTSSDSSVAVLALALKKNVLTSPGPTAKLTSKTAKSLPRTVLATQK